MKETQSHNSSDTINSETGKFDFIRCHKLILDNINDVIGISTKEDGIIYLSPSVLKEAGWSEKELHYKNIFDIALEADISTIKEAFSRLDIDKEVTFEWRSKTKDNRYEWVETTVKNSICEEDNIEYRVFSCRNIQRRKELEAQLQSKADELANLNNMKDKFFSLIAHDLKNPMFSLITLTEFIQSKISTLTQSEILDFINQINDSAKNSFILLENLLEWAKSQSGSIEFKPEKVKIENVILECWRLAKSQAANKNISISIETSPELYANADHKMLSTIVRNIISNAIKYTPEYGKVSVIARREDNNVLLIIEDSGIGMNKEQLKYLFTTDTRKQLNGIPSQHGSGLGLVLCKEFIDRHNGQISVESSFGNGSKFIIRIPLTLNSDEVD